MTLFDKLLYLADYVEPLRAFRAWRRCAPWWTTT